MEVYREEKIEKIRGASLALGMFDGLHIGHQSVIGEAVKLARQEGIPSCVYTFSNHPLSVLGNGKEPVQLQSEEERLCCLKKMGVDCVLLLPFTKEYAARKAEEFASVVLQAKHISLGENYSFGAMGKGNAALLREMANGTSCRVHVQPLVYVDGAPVSSTRIRKAIENGDFATVQKMMGSPGTGYDSFADEEC